MEPVGCEFGEFCAVACVVGCFDLRQHGAAFVCHYLTGQIDQVEFVGVGCA